MLFRLIRLYIPSALMTLSTSRANNLVETTRGKLLRKQVCNQFFSFLRKCHRELTKIKLILIEYSEYISKRKFDLPFII